LLTELALKIPLTLNAKEWAHRVLKQTDGFQARADVSARLRDAGYDIKAETERVMNYYCAFPDA